MQALKGYNARFEVLYKKRGENIKFIQIPIFHSSKYKPP